MKHANSEVDAYIKNAPAYSQPILHHIRELMHAGCPDVEEEIKWGVPNFVYCGKVMVNMAAFKEHVSFGFWKQELIPGMDAYVKDQEAKGMWKYMKR